MAVESKTHIVISGVMSGGWRPISSEAKDDDHPGEGR